MSGSGGKLGDNYRRSKKIQPGANRKKFENPSPIAGTGLAKKIGGAIKSGAVAVRNTVGGGDPNPENSAAWKARQKEIDNRKLRNTGARIRKSGKV